MTVAERMALQNSRAESQEKQALQEALSVEEAVDMDYPSEEEQKDFNELENKLCYEGELEKLNSQISNNDE